ncbi:MAG TPA: hypothetical protein VGZ72_16295 [Stellaceae bacterium]|jgi:hypothetical protein|nr:hypothetical protein [Stellaceae bacterium]
MRAAAATLDPTPLDLGPVAESDAAAGLDLVTICILAVNRLAPATLRSATFGKALTVVVPDPRVGAVFRAALERMGAKRSTDRLIEIVVEPDSRPS